MTLESKGPVLPPPVLSKYLQPLSETIQQWEGIIAATHWDLYDNTLPDGADFYAGKEELGHIHLDGAVHLATDKMLSGLLLKNKLAEKFPWGGENAFWVLFNIRSAADAAHAKWLFELNYERLLGRGRAALLASVQAKLKAV